MSGNEYARPHVLIETGDVAADLYDPTIRLVEVDVDTTAYEHGHLEGAVGWDWKRDLQRQPVRDIPTAEEWEALLLLTRAPSLVEIARKASTLVERIEHARASGDGPDPRDRKGGGTPLLRAHVAPPRAPPHGPSGSRLDEWCRAVAKGDWALFRKRLAWGGLDIEAARRALDPAVIPARRELPAWANTLAEVPEVASEAAPIPVATPREPAAPGTRNGSAPAATAAGAIGEDTAARPIPFEDVLAPFVLVARRRLAEQVGDRRRLLAEGVHAGLERHLLANLSRAAAETLLLEFSVLRSREQAPLDRLLSAAVGDRSALYRRFLERLHSGGFVPFFREYAVLARLLATIVDLWVDANAELLDRLAADLPDLQARFGGGAALGRIVAAEPAPSDPHRGRRFVVALTFASGRRLVYKPKGLGVDAAFNRLLAWLNERGAPLPFRVVEVLDRPDHGWVEHVEPGPCPDRDAARRYFRRAGMLLALVHLLEGTDCHVENLIASGEHLVLVDLETLLHHRVPEPRAAGGIQAQSLAYGQLAESVLRSGLLPVWQVAQDGRLAYDISGLGGRGDQQAPALAPTWTHINTDAMHLESKPRIWPAGPNVPTLDGAQLALGAHAEDLVEGFRQMYRFLLDQRGALLAPDSPLHALARQRVRFIHRPTTIYGLILVKLFAPKYLRDGADRGIQLELLTRALLGFEAAPPFWPIVEAEQRAMEQLDIPLFTAPADGTDLQIAPGRTIEACFPEPSFQLVLDRLRTLDDEEDLERQVAFVEGSLYAHLARATVATSSSAVTWDEPGTEPLAAEASLVRAVAIAEQLRARAIRAGDGSAAWIAPHYLPRAERYQLWAVGDDLYGGNTGIALFLAAVYRATGRADYRDLALAALAAPRHNLRTAGGWVADQRGIGGALGLGSLVYGLVTVNRLLDEPALLDDARRAAELITLERIAADTRLDVVAGCAGALLGLLSLHAARQDSDALERAAACGRRLLEARTPSSIGLRAWATDAGHLMNGAAHGAAGIAYALLRLFQATGERDFRDAAEEGIAYERGRFSPEASNWPDVRQQGDGAFLVQWCHGATGIGLARLGGLAALDTPEIRRDVEVALETTLRTGVGDLDQLCCGNLGRAELLIAAADRLARPELAQWAGRLVAEVAARAERAGGFALHPLLPRTVQTPTLFQGTAGIGYTMLRLARPDLLSVLLWE